MTSRKELTLEELYQQLIAIDRERPEIAEGSFMWIACPGRGNNPQLGHTGQVYLYNNSSWVPLDEWSTYTRAQNLHQKIIKSSGTADCDSCKQKS